MAWTDKDEAAKGKSTVGVMGINRHGLNFETPDGRPVHCILLLLSSTDEPERHLQLLAMIAGTIGYSIAHDVISWLTEGSQSSSAVGAPTAGLHEERSMTSTARLRMWSPSVRSPVLHDHRDVGRLVEEPAVASPFHTEAAHEQPHPAGHYRAWLPTKSPSVSRPTLSRPPASAPPATR